MSKHKIFVEKLRFDFGNEPEFIQDCRFIQSVLFNHGLDATLRECSEIWKLYSDDFDAGWMAMSYDKKIMWNTIKGYIK